jgi:hypothetical protein
LLGTIHHFVLVSITLLLEFKCHAACSSAEAPDACKGLMMFIGVIPRSAQDLAGLMTQNVRGHVPAQNALYVNSPLHCWQSINKEGWEHSTNALTEHATRIQAHMIQNF